MRYETRPEEAGAGLVVPGVLVMFTANKFLIAIQAALAVAATSLAPYLSGVQIACVAIAQAFVGAFGVYQVSNSPKA